MCAGFFSFLEHSRASLSFQPGSNEHGAKTKAFNMLAGKSCIVNKKSSTK